MQSKILTAAIAALSLPTVQCGVVAPRQFTISPSYFVLPGVSFDPGVLQPTDACFQTLDSMRGEILKTTDLANTIATNTANGVLLTAVAANAIATQITTNVVNIVTKITQLVNRIAPTLPSPSNPSTPGAPNLPDLGGAAENLVRAVQGLTRAVTAQLDALRSQAAGPGGAILTSTIPKLQANLQAALNTLGGIVRNALTLAASATANVREVYDRIRAAQIKLDPVLIIGLQPEIVF